MTPRSPGNALPTRRYRSGLQGIAWQLGRDQGLSDSEVFANFGSLLEQARIREEGRRQPDTVYNTGNWATSFAMNPSYYSAMVAENDRIIKAIIQSPEPASHEDAIALANQIYDQVERAHEQGRQFGE